MRTIVLDDARTAAPVYRVYAFPKVASEEEEPCGGKMRICYFYDNCTATQDKQQ